MTDLPRAPEMLENVALLGEYLSAHVRGVGGRSQQKHLVPFAFLGPELSQVSAAPSAPPACTLHWSSLTLGAYATRASLCIFLPMFITWLKLEDYGKKAADYCWPAE